MPTTATTTISDPCDYQAAFRGATIDLVFTSPGVFRARLTTVNLPRVRLCCLQESLPRIAYVALTREMVNFAFSRSLRPSIWGGAELKSQDLMFHSLGEGMHQRMHGAVSWSSLRNQLRR